METSKRTYLEIVWHLVRSSRHFDTDEIERMSGAKRATVLEYLNRFKQLGHLRRIGLKNWQLIKDPGPATPGSTKTQLPQTQSL